nr:MAG TPA: hypothetical protein [Caudoviricetes sp.]
MLQHRDIPMHDLRLGAICSAQPQQHELRHVRHPGVPRTTAYDQNINQTLINQRCEGFRYRPQLGKRRFALHTNHNIQILHCFPFSSSLYDDPSATKPLQLAAKAL